MGTTRIKVIDLSSSEKEIKTSRKHASLAPLAKRAEKLAELEKLKKEVRPQNTTSEQAKILSLKNPGVPVQEQIETEFEQKVKTQKPKATLSKKDIGHKRGKKYLQAKQLIENRLYAKDEAFKLLPKTSTVKFDPTVEIHLNVTDKNIKGNLTFPYLKSQQKERKYLIFSDKKSETKKQVIWANEKTVADIEKGILKPGKDFDTVVSTPKFMPTLAKVAKILGPKGLMPNPKNGTITEDIDKVLEGTGNNNLYAYKCDPTAPIIHTKIGKLSQKETELSENLKILVATIGPSKIINATLTTSMGPGIRLNIASI